jgi:cell division protein FtsW
VLTPATIFGVCAVLILVETHLSGAILIISIGVILLIASGCKFRYLMPIGSLALIGALVAVFFTDYMQKRLYTWLHPEEDLSGDAFQISQSLYTIGSGGLFGLGYGRSRQKYMYLPEPQSDFIFSIVCEELGYIGAIFIIVLFAILIWRGIYIAINAPNKFS